MDISLTELENAINEWRARRPSTGEERALSPEVNALAGIYAQMIYHRQTSLPLASLDPVVRQLLEAWLTR
jgi:hypothetical protein